MRSANTTSRASYTGKMRPAARSIPRRVKTMAAEHTGRYARTREGPCWSIVLFVYLNWSHHSPQNSRYSMSAVFGSLEIAMAMSFAAPLMPSGCVHIRSSSKMATRFNPFDQDSIKILSYCMACATFTIVNSPAKRILRSIDSVTRFLETSKAKSTSSASMRSGKSKERNSPWLTSSDSNSVADARRSFRGGKLNTKASKLCQSLEALNASNLFELIPASDVSTLSKLLPAFWKSNGLIFCKKLAYAAFRA
mmetsp:Transcript_80786/g.216627  ORF Transcript_80786/g.216627 Transcript_80786/m.216627 type:complete len:251 (-) Transcript_80786:105-857(-)